MFRKIGFFIFASAVLLQSCSVNTETTYFKDSATSMESNILMDQSMMGMMNMMGSGNDLKKMTDLGELTTDWKSLYDIQKKGKITLNQDSVKVLKKMFMKLNKDNGEILGLSMKYDHLLPGEIAMLLSQSRQMKKLPLQDIAQWNGKVLTIDTEKFNSAEFLRQIGDNADRENVPVKPKTKSDSLEVYGKQMAQGMMGMLKMVNVNFTNTLKFQKPIKSIVGKHDFVKQVDSKTVQINLRSKDLLNEGKELLNKDKKIVITTE